MQHPLLQLITQFSSFLDSIANAEVCPSPLQPTLQEGPQYMYM